MRQRYALHPVSSLTPCPIIRNALEIIEAALPHTRYARRTRGMHHLSLRATTASATSAGRHSLHRLHLLHLRQYALPHPQINQRLHRLRVLVRQQAVESTAVDEVHEARVELAVTAGVPEEEPVLPVEVGVAAEHLLVPNREKAVSACDILMGR